MMPQRRGIRRDQEVSALALAPSAPPPDTRKERALREKEKGKEKETSTLATGQGLVVLSREAFLWENILGTGSIAGGGVGPASI